MRNRIPDSPKEVRLYVGIDCADSKHDCYEIDLDGKGFHQEIPHSPESISSWIAEMLNLADGGSIAAMLEQSRGPLIYAQIFRKDVLLYPIDPKPFAPCRESYPGPGKEDSTHSRYLARMLRERIATLTPWRSDVDETRLIANLAEHRRKIVGSRQQLISYLKSYFPLALELFGTEWQLSLLLTVLSRCDDPRKFPRADRRLIRRVLAEHSKLSERQQSEIIDRIRSAQLLSSDKALITPMALTDNLMVKQIQQSRNSVQQFAAEIDRLMKEHLDAHLFTSLLGAGRIIAPRLEAQTMEAKGERTERSSA